MTVGTLRDQVIYPHLAEGFRRHDSTDTDLEDILNKVWTTVCIMHIVYFLLFYNGRLVFYVLHCLLPVTLYITYLCH